MNEFKVGDFVIDKKPIYGNSKPLMFVINHINHINHPKSLELKRYKGEDSLTYIRKIYSLTYIRKFNQVKKITKEDNPEYFV